MAHSPLLADVIAAIDGRYPADLAEDWDASGLVCGDPHAPVRSILFAVDPVMDVVDEAMLLGADLIVVHHPLFLRAVHSVAATTPGGRVAHTLIAHGLALFTAHTNADSAPGGVSDALAEALGVVGTSPLAPDAYDPSVGIGRVGRLPIPVRLDVFAALVADALPGTHHGVRVAGDPASIIETVAVCGGSGDDYLGAAAAVADVFVTSDLRHHRALDHRLAGGCALVDVAHWAGEWPWLSVAAEQLRSDLAELGSTVEVHVSAIPTDPWTAHLGSTR